MFLKIGNNLSVMKIDTEVVINDVSNKIISSFFTFNEKANKSTC